MDLGEKLEILSQAARYDVSCASSGSRRAGRPGGVGNAADMGICHSWTSDGRCVSLLKILFTNSCAYDCAYCANGRSQDRRRAAFTPEEVADLTLNFYRRNYIEGLFLSSGVLRNPDYTMELLSRTVRILREERRFDGYVHLKVIPGADEKLVAEAGRHVDRLSVNIELPSEKSLSLLCPEKRKEEIFGPMGRIYEGIADRRAERSPKSTLFVPAGQSTQLIVGATTETDRRIVQLAENLYGRYGLKRVYYSAFTQVTGHPALPAVESPPLGREHRLYQADWLLRFYGFSAGELLSKERPNLDPDLDPKCSWALENLSRFPVEVNEADYETLLRVPGVGVRSARRIVAARRHHSLDHEDLKRIGVVMKRARLFVTCRGKYIAPTGGAGLREDRLRRALLEGPPRERSRKGDPRQLSLFPDTAPGAGFRSAVTGEI